MHPIHLDPALCTERFGKAALLTPGTLLLSVTDGAFASCVSPSTPFCPHYGYDKVRFVNMAFSGDAVSVEFVVKDKAVRNRTYGIVSFQTTVHNQDGATLLAVEDKLAVPFRDTERLP
jgi:acyl dehydratase